MARLLFFLLVLTIIGHGHGNAKSRPKVLALYENGGHHLAFSQKARVWLDSLARVHQFDVEYRQTADEINEQFLNQFALVFQMDFVPYGWPPQAMAAFEKYVSQGKGGWVGLHHATLLGEFDGFTMWPWFSNFMGGVTYKAYIPTFASATVEVEEKEHPVMKGVPANFTIAGEEWYIYDKSPRANVQVLAHVNEDTYSPESPITMGDHPVIWSNLNMKARNVYIFMGHSPALFENQSYTKLLQNAILWAIDK